MIFSSCSSSIFAHRSLKPPFLISVLFPVIDATRPTSLVSKPSWERFFPRHVATRPGDHDACPRSPLGMQHTNRARAEILTRLVVFLRLAKMCGRICPRGRHASLGLSFALISGSASIVVPSASLILLHVSERGSGGSMTVPWIRYGHELIYDLHFAPRGYRSTHARSFRITSE